MTDADDTMAAADPVGTAVADGQRIIVAEVLGAAFEAGLLPAEASDTQVDAVHAVLRGRSTRQSPSGGRTVPR